MADLPQIPVQPESNDVNRRRRPHPGAATLKTLTVSPDRRADAPSTAFILQTLN
jgi:hypothetical protein